MRVMAIIILVAIIVWLFLIGDFSQERKVIFSKEAPAPIGPYSQGIKIGNTLYVSGQIALNQDVLDTSSIEKETEIALKNIQHIVEAAEMKMQDVSKCTIYLSDLKMYKRVNEVYAGFFKENPPARETVEVRALPKGAHVEISAVALGN